MIYLLKIFLVFALAALINNCSSTNEFFKKTSPPKTHHTGNGFTNPHVQNDKNLFDVISMRWFSEDWKEWDNMEKRRDALNVNRETINNPGEYPQATWIGHSTVLLQYRGINILTDPVFSDYASPVRFLGPKRKYDPAISLEQLPQIDFVIISHNHYDHIDTKFVKFMGNKTKWLVPLKIKEWLLDYDIAPSNIFELDWWDEAEFENIKFTCTPAQHFSGRGLGDMNKTLWCSWAVEIYDFNFWFGGDTGYNEKQFKEIGNKFCSFDLAMIPIGAYRPRWFMKSAHINPEEAAIIHREINSKYSFGIHWSTFRLSAEGMFEPVKDLSTALEKLQIPRGEFEALRIGETVFVKAGLD